MAKPSKSMRAVIMLVFVLAWIWMLAGSIWIVVKLLKLAAGGGEPVSLFLIGTTIGAASIVVMLPRYIRRANYAGDKEQSTENFLYDQCKAEFSPANYSRLDNHTKVRLLAELVGADFDKLVRILEMPNQALHDYFVEDKIRPAYAERVDQFLSVLAYVLRLAEYQPTEMPKIWQAIGLFHESAAPPPWDQMGLDTYLATHGPSGVQAALLWIRAH